VAPNLGMACWRPERGTESSRRSTVAITGWGATAVTSELLRLAATWYKGHGVVRSWWTTYTSTTTARPRRRRKWMGDRATTVLRTHPWGRSFFTTKRNPLTRGTNHGGRRESRRGAPAARGAEPGIWFSYCSIIMSFKASDRTHLGWFTPRFM
jgi:hypothetical protein